MVVLLPWPCNRNRWMAIFTYFHVKPVFVVQMLTKQPFSFISIGASINFAHPHSPFTHLIYNFQVTSFGGTSP
jgi:hypothetical protein